jgi:hypothetical protein
MALEDRYSSFARMADLNSPPAEVKPRGKFRAVASWQLGSFGVSRVALLRRVGHQ